MIAILPQQKWEWSSSGQPLDANCPMAQFSTVSEYHSAVLQQMRPDAKIEGFRRSFSSDLRWEAAIAGHNQTMGRIANEGAMARSRITAQTYESIREMSQSAWESRQKSADHSAREFSEYLRDVETYDDPMSSTGQVELDSSYEHAGRMDDGTYILTNDHSFNPVEAYGQFGEELGASGPD